MVKYQAEIKEVIRDFIDRKNLAEPDIINQIGNEFLKEVILSKEDSFSDYSRAIRNKFPKDAIEYYKAVVLKEEINENEIYVLPNETIIKMLKYYGINTPERREKFLSNINELKDLFIELLNGEKYYEFHDKYQEFVFEYTDKEYEETTSYLKKFIPMGLILSIVCSPENYLDLSKELVFSLKNCGWKFVKFLITDIEHKIGEILGYRKTKSIMEMFSEIKDLGSEEEEEDENENIFKIKHQRDSYKTTIRLYKNELSRIEKRIEEEAKEAKEEAIKEFYITLNSDKYGNFLDKIPLTEKVLFNIRKKNYGENESIPEEVRKVLIFIKQVLKFVKDSGITPMDEIGRTFEGSAEDIEKMNYIGNFFEENEVKSLKVKTPGYKYGNIIISLPTVEEVEE